jgi:hypothetical protein
MIATNKIEITFDVSCYDKDGKLKWRDTTRPAGIENKEQLKPILAINNSEVNDGGRNTDSRTEPHS